MDVHKPGRVRGWREFLKEVGIIVLGVLIALGGEQAVAALHERHEAAQARENIRDELAVDLASLRNRAATEGCIARRLDEVTATLAGAAQRGYTPPRWIGRPQYWPMFEAKWQAATSAGRATLLSASEQASYGQLYYTLGLLGAVEPQEQAAWARLRMLEDAPSPERGLLAQVRAGLVDARLNDWQVRLFTVRSQELARGLGLADVAPQHRGSMGVCVPMSTPRPVALARLQQFTHDQLGEP